MNQALSERLWQAEARTEETKRLVQDIKHTTRRKFSTFIEYYNHRRYHEVLGNVTPCDIYTGRHLGIIGKGKEVESTVLAVRRDNNRTTRKRGSGL